MRATMAKADALDELVDSLPATSIGRTFNQYRDTCVDDAEPTSAPRTRLENLRTYLHARAAAGVVIVPEAAGYRGARHSGIPLLSERLIDESRDPWRRTSTHSNGWAEPSASIVRGLLREGGWEEATLIWNVIPTHPQGATPHSNRPPLRGEEAAGRDILLRLLDILRPRHIVALGRTAQAALPAELHATPVRHPAQSGATLCRAQLGEALSEWLR